MTDVLQEFLVKLGFSVDQNSLSGFIGSVESASTRIAAFGAAMTAAAAEVIHSIEEISAENRELGLLAIQMKSSAGAIDDFIDTSSMLGISTETSTNSLKNFSKNVSDAYLGIGRGKIIFEKLKIPIKEANGAVRSTMDVMSDLMTKLQGMDRATQLNAMERLGIDPSMITMFNDEFGKTKYIVDQLDKIDVAAGFNLDTAIDQSNRFQISWKGMTTEINLFKMLFSKMYEAIAVRMMPKIRQGIEAFSKTIEAARRVVMDNAGQIEAFLEPIIDVILRIGTAFTKLFGTAFTIISSVLSPIFSMMMKVNEATNGWAGYIAAALVAWRVFNLGFLATPLGMILSLSVAILALVDDFMVWKEGGDSLINWGNTFGQTIMYIGAGLVGLATSIGIVKAAMTAYAIAQNIVSVAVLAFNILFRATPFGLMITGITALVAAGYYLINNWDKVKKWFTDFFGWFENKGKTIADIASKIAGGFGKSLGSLGDKFSATLGVGGAGGGGSVHQSTVINVNGAQNPHATAQLVHAQQSNVNAQVTRNMKAVVR